MTTRITVSNPDQGATAVVTTIGKKLDANFQPTGEEVAISGATELAPGASQDFWIHSGQAIRIDEKKTS